MNDLLSPDEAEDRLRRTFARRAERMAAGDGAGAPYDRPAAPVVALTPLDPGDDRFDRGPVPSVGRRLVLAAATVAAVVGIGVAAAVSSRGGDPGDAVDTAESPEPTAGDPATPTTAPGPDPTTETTAPDCSATTSPTTAPAPAGGETAGTLPPALEESIARRTEIHDAQPPHQESPPLPGQDRDIIGAYAGEYIEGEGPVELTLERKDFFPFDGGGMPGIEPIQAGENHGWLIPMPGSDGRLMAARLEFGDQLVLITGLRVDRQLVLDVAASVRREGDTFTFTPPAGLTEVCY